MVRCHDRNVLGNRIEIRTFSELLEIPARVAHDIPLQSGVGVYELRNNEHININLAFCSKDSCKRLRICRNSPIPRFLRTKDKHPDIGIQQQFIFGFKFVAGDRDYRWRTDQTAALYLPAFRRAAHPPAQWSETAARYCKHQQFCHSTPVPLPVYLQTAESGISPATVYQPQ